MSEREHNLTADDLEAEAEELDRIARSLEDRPGNNGDLVERIREVARNLRTDPDDDSEQSDDSDDGR